MKKTNVTGLTIALLTFCCAIAPLARAENTPRLYSRQLGFYITAKGVPPNATANIEILAAGRLLGTYRSVPLGVENHLDEDYFPRYTPLVVHIAINYADPLTGVGQHYVDDPLTLPANTTEALTTYGIEYDLREPNSTAAKF